MRHFILILLLLASGTTILTGQGIEFFHGSWEEALAKAKQEDKPIFVDAYASWCGPCKRMAAQVFPQPEVGEVFNANFISLKLDMEKPEAATFRVDHPVRAYPTLFFLDTEGNTIHTVVGGQQPKGLISQARTALGKVDNLEKYTERYTEGERDPAFMLKYIRALVRQGESHLKVANDYLRTQKGQLDQPDNLRILAVAATEADSRIFDQLMEHREAAVKLLSAEAIDKQIRLAFANTKAKVIELRASDLLERAAKKYQGIDADAADAFLLDGELQLAASGNDEKDFYKAAKKYHKKAAAGDDKALVDLFQLLTESKFIGTDDKLQDLAESIGGEAAELTNDYRNYYLLGKWLNEVGRNEAALTAAEKSKQLIPESQPNTHRLVDFLIKQIQEG